MKTWWKDSQFTRSLLVQKWLQIALGFFIPFESWDSENSTYTTLWQEFVSVCEECKVLQHPHFLGERIPPTALHFASQLSDALGLHPNHPIRKFLERCVFMELYVLKVLAFHDHWCGGRLFHMPKIVDDKLRSSGVGSADIILRHSLTVPAVLKQMDDSRLLYKTSSHRSITLKSCLPGMSTDEIFLIDDEGQTTFGGFTGRKKECFVFDRSISRSLVLILMTRRTRKKCR